MPKQYIRNSNITRVTRFVLGGLFVIVSIFGSMQSLGASPFDWHDTGVVIQEKQYAFCFDGSQSNVILLANQDAGTVAYNWVDQTRTHLNARPYDLCAPNGLLFSADDQSNPDRGGALRFSSNVPQGQHIEFMPTHVAQDGTELVYALTERLASIGRTVWVSKDGGLNWQDNGKQFNGRVSSVAILDANATSVFVLIAPDMDRLFSSRTKAEYAVYYSGDAGLHWEQRGTLNTVDVDGGIQSVSLSSLPGSAASVDNIAATISTSYDASNSGTSKDLYLSSDGGLTFQLVGTIKPDLPNNIQLFSTQEGILRLRIDPIAAPDNQRQFHHELDLLPYEERVWQTLSLPLPANLQRNASLDIIRSVPANVFFYSEDNTASSLYYSANGGRTWQYVSDSYAYISPYLPLTLLSVKDQHLYALSLPSSNTGSSVSTGTVANNVPGGTYFPETRYNLSGIFKDYWDQHGGLAQQGFPLSEPIQEVSEINGRVYTTQYFERSIFEYHPENGPPNDVQLSLVGSLLYQQKYPDGGLFQTPNLSSGSILFPETGKHLGGLFLEYWTAHGGLAQQGYPISDEFMEKSDLDGKTYKVQYFERAEFELHPEHAGTPYEVQVSLLGRFRLTDRYGGGPTELPLSP
ncbi:MAG TPA: sialidase family protein [Chloroflexia bacterium]|nr:sialidase family protein [Chloroflexia bacterium]